MSHDAFAPAPEHTGSEPQARQTKPLLRAGSSTIHDDTGSLKRWMARIVAALIALKNRTRERRDLQYLLEEAPPHLLNDVGLTRDQIEQELHRLGRDPFWHR